MHQAAELCRHHKLSGYDAIDAAGAKIVGGVWITADVAAHRKIAGLKISMVVGKH